MVLKIQLNWAGEVLVRRIRFPKTLGKVPSDVLAAIVAPVWTSVPRELFLWNMRSIGRDNDSWATV